MGYADGLNLYRAYMGVNYIDPMGNEIFTISLIGLYGAFKFAISVFAVSAAIEIARQEVYDEERDWASVVSSGRTGVLLSVPGVGLMRAGLYGKMLLAGAGGYITGQGAVNTYESGKQYGWGDKRTLFSGGLTALGAFGTILGASNIVYGKGGFVRNYKAAKLKNTKYGTTPMSRRYITENLPGNKVHRNGGVVKYLTEAERQELLVKIKNGKFYNSKGELFNSTGETAGGTKGSIFVMDDKGRIYISNSSKYGEFHHSSFFGGKPVAAAGEILVENGTLKYFSNNSGHYWPSEVYHNQFRIRLIQKHVDLSKVIDDPITFD